MSYLERAITDGHAKLSGEGKQPAVPALNGGASVSRAALAHGKSGGADQFHNADNHTERYADPEEQVRDGFWAELIYRYGYEPARIGVEPEVRNRNGWHRRPACAVRPLAGR
jgi:type I restriction enzyme M protein